jgi:hypothetical protein
MSGNIKLVASLVICLTVILSFSVLSQADNGEPFIPPATQNALQQQGFIQQDAGGSVGTNQMPLNNFREADQLNSGNIFGRLRLADSDSPIPRDRVFFNYNHFANGAPDTRSMGFEADSDHYIPIARLREHIN